MVHNFDPDVSKKNFLSYDKVQSLRLRAQNMLEDEKYSQVTPNAVTELSFAIDVFSIEHQSILHRHDRDIF